MSGRKPLIELPAEVQRIIVWCDLGQTLVADDTAAGRRYRFTPGGPHGPCLSRRIPPRAAEQAIASGYLAPADGGLFGAVDARAWRARAA